MTTLKWWERPCVAFDTESTGTDPLSARIVTAAVIHLTPRQEPRLISWLIDPGIDVPDEAAEVHGWTTERIKDALAGAEARRTMAGDSRPMSAAAAIDEVVSHLGTAMAAEAGIFAFNVAYDATLLETECARLDVPGISDRSHGWAGLVDAMVIDKARDPYRPGKCDGQQKRAPRCECGADGKKLTDLCRHFGVPLGADAHDAGADALAAARLGYRLVTGWPDVARLKLSTLHERQVEWRAQQSRSLRDYWRRLGDERWSEVDEGWPLHSSLAGRAAA